MDFGYNSLRMKSLTKRWLAVITHSEGGHLAAHMSGAMAD